MVKIIEGVLVYDQISGRYQIRYGVEDYTSGLHCGETLQVYWKSDKQWHDTRIEYSHDIESWYLVGCCRQFQLDGAKVRYAS